MAIADRLTLRSVFTLADGVTPLPLSALSHNRIRQRCWCWDDQQRGWAAAGL